MKQGYEEAPKNIICFDKELYIYDSPAWCVTVDIVVVAAQVTHMLLIKRAKDPYKGKMALPGAIPSRGFLEDIVQECPSAYHCW